MRVVVVVQGGLGCYCVKRVGLLLCRIFERRLTQGSDPTKVRSALAQAAAHLPNQKAKDKFVSVRESNTGFRGTEGKRVWTQLELERNRSALGCKSSGNSLEPGGPERKGPPDDEIV